MTWAGWLFLLMATGIVMYRRGYASGADAARQLGRLAVEQERLRCRELRMTQVFGRRAERLTRPHHAECN